MAGARVLFARSIILFGYSYLLLQGSTQSYESRCTNEASGREFIYDNKSSRIADSLFICSFMRARVRSFDHVSEIDTRVCVW